MGIGESPRHTNTVGLYLDPRVKFVGVSKLRKINRKTLKAFGKGEQVFVFQKQNGERLAVMIPFKIYKRIQDSLLYCAWVPGNKLAQKEKQ